MNPREGEIREHWQADTDEIVTAVYRGGAWSIVRRENHHERVRDQQRMQQAHAMLAYQQLAQQHIPQNALHQGGLGGYNQVAINTAQLRDLMYPGTMMQFRGNNYLEQTYTVTTTSPEAVARAKELLLSHLDPTQKIQFEAEGTFEITGGATKRTYRIASNPIPGKNVTWMENGKPHISYDAHPVDGRLPAGDIMLAQKLALENPEMEVEFTRIACRHQHGGSSADGAFWIEPGTVRFGQFREVYGANILPDACQAPPQVQMVAQLDDPMYEEANPAVLFFVLTCTAAMGLAALLIR